jgi:hypothetical protein
MRGIFLGLATIAIVVGATPALADATVVPSFDQHPGNVAVQQKCPVRNTDRYSKAILASKPSAYYRLDESSGPVLCDSSPAHLNGTYASTGITYGVAGPLSDGANTAVRSTGQPGDIAVGGTPSISGAHSFTLEGWFKKTGKLQNQILADIGQAGTGEIAGLATWSSNASTSPITTCPALAASAIALDSYASSNCWNTAAAGVNLWNGKWHYLALVYNAAKVTITAYVDGTSLGSQTPQAGPLNLQASPIRIGNWVDTVVNQPFIGGAADIAVYPRVLPSATILAHWHAA